MSIRKDEDCNIKSCSVAFYKYNSVNPRDRFADRRRRTLVVDIIAFDNVMMFKTHEAETSSTSLFIFLGLLRQFCFCIALFRVYFSPFKARSVF